MPFTVTRGEEGMGMNRFSTHAPKGRKGFRRERSDHSKLEVGFKVKPFAEVAQPFGRRVGRGGPETLGALSGTE